MSEQTSQATLNEESTIEETLYDHKEKDVVEGEAVQEEESNPEEKVEDTKDEKIIPEEYILDLGEDTNLSKEHIEEISQYAKEKGFSNDEAQELLNRDNTLLSNFQKSSEDAHEKEVNGWEEAIKSDKEIGGDNFNQSVEYAKRIVTKYATPEFLEQLNESGYGNHPELVRLFSRLGKAMADDTTILDGQKSTTTKKSTEELFYGSDS